MAEGYLPHTYARPDDSEIGLYIPRLRDGPITAQAYHNSSGPRTSSSAPAPAYLPQGNRHTYLSTPALATDLTSTYSYSSAEPASATSATSTTSVPPLVLAFPSPSPSGSADSERPAVTVPTKPSKRKKTKEQIPLAGDQPLTTQGTSRQRVYLACSQCRTRKIRCDGAKPVCNHCVKRGVHDCVYDSAPKRRGPDRTPGARQRLAGAEETLEAAQPTRTRRRRKNRGPFAKEETAEVEVEATVLASPVEDYGHGSSPTVASEEAATSSFVNAFLGMPEEVYPQATSSHYPPVYGSAYITDEDGRYTRDETHMYRLVAEPTMDFARKTWWDSLLSLYYAPEIPPHLLGALTLSQRDLTTRSITSDLRFLWRVSNYWFSFVHVPTFFGRLFDPVRRAQMQPSLILAALALATFFQSSEVNRGDAGRRMALRLRDEAQISLEASVNARWIDEDLAQAAWLIAMFEVCAHPLHSTQRARDSMVTLDSVISVLCLTSLDREDPHVTTYIAHPALPSLPATRPAPPPVHSLQPTPRGVYRQLQSLEHTHAARGAHGVLSAPAPPSELRAHAPCACVQLSLGASSPLAQEHTPMWMATARWSDNWSEAEVRKESCRRLCWSTLALAAGHTSYASANTGNGLDLSITNPVNFALFFNGEATSRAMTPAGAGVAERAKGTVWALYNRVMLLWHSCLRMRVDATLSYPEKAQFAMASWHELDAIERALNAHTCDLEKSFMFQGREIIFNARMVISYEYQKFIPDVTTNFNGFFHRSKAEEWLHRQNRIAKGAMLGLSTVTGLTNNRLAERPFMVFWFMAQVSRALMLWRVDSALTLALDVAEAWLGPIDYLATLWPCPTQRTRYDALRQQIIQACAVAGRQPPRALDVASFLPANLGTLI